jgi:hypothetical protein
VGKTVERIEACDSGREAATGTVGKARAGSGSSQEGVGRIDFRCRRPDTAAMGVRTRGLDIKAGAAKLKADRAARLEAELVVDRWNRRLATGRDMLWSPTIRAALLGGTPWLDVFCPGCGTSRVIDLRTLDRHPLASVGTLVLGLRCSWCPGSAPMPKLLGLYALPPARRQGVAL